MEKVSLYLKNILAFLISFGGWYVIPFFLDHPDYHIMVYFLPVPCLVFSFLHFRITGHKPGFLSGIARADYQLRRAGYIQVLLRLILMPLALVYELAAWSAYGAYLVFLLMADLLMIINYFMHGIFYAVTWFINRLFPPVVFLFRLFLHYLIRWPWWIYRSSARNAVRCLNWNYYRVALWGSVPAVFIVFLFYALSLRTAIPQVVAISYLFSVLPLIWSFTEIGVIRYHHREDLSYRELRSRFGNGFEAVRSSMAYFLLLAGIVCLEILFNLLGWIPGPGFVLMGIALNLNMFLSILFIILAGLSVLLVFVMPSYVLYRPEPDAFLKKSFSFAGVAGRRFARYLFSLLPSGLFGALLMAVPAGLMILAFQGTDQLKNRVTELRIEHLEDQMAGSPAGDSARIASQIQMLDYYRDMPLNVTRDFATIDPGFRKIPGFGVQVPVVFLLLGIFTSIFGGMVLAVMIAYLGNLFFELYTLREDGRPSFFRKTLTDIRSKDPDQPLLGVTFFVLLAAGGVIIYLYFRSSGAG